MKFLLDENFPVVACSLLNEHGHIALCLADIGMLGATDESVFLRALQEEAILLTTDRDFFHTIPFLYESHFGVVVIALRQPCRSAIIARLTWFLNHAPQSMKNRVLLLRDNTHTMR